jgi:hypothetical protein
VVEIVFMMLILKLPILYLIGVCWWAVRAEPEPLEGARLRAVVNEDLPQRWRPRPGRRPPRGGPHTAPRGRSSRVRA